MEISKTKCSPPSSLFPDLGKIHLQLVRNAFLMRHANIRGDAGLWKLITSPELRNLGLMAALPKLLGSSDIKTAKTWVKVERHQQESTAKDREPITRNVVLCEGKQT